MNLLPLLLGFVLLGTVSKQNKKENAFDLSQILSNPDLVSLLPNVAKLFDKTATDDDKNLAIMALLTNPVIFEIVQKFATKNQDPTNENKQPQSEEKTEQNQEENNNKQTEKNNKQQTFSDESKEFFAPINGVADKQISKKLYALYDNWYIKK